MSVAASRPPAPVAAPAPVPTSNPTPADREPAAHPFAEMLRQNRGIEHRPPVDAAKPMGADIATARGEPTPGSTPTESDASLPANDSLPRSDAGRARARVGATTARSAARPSGAAERTDRGPASGTERSAQDDDRSPADAAGTTPTNPALAVRPDVSRPADAELRPGAAAQRSAAAGIGRDTDAGVASASTAPIEGAADSDSAARGGDAVARADTGRGAARARSSEAATPAASFAPILADAKAADGPAARTPTPDAAPPLPATAIAAHEAQAPAALDATPASPAATLPVPVDSPEFAAAFGVQVSVFVREGVQHAELHLNPAETGPVSIAITLEGSQAHVEFGADLAATRQAIENGLPALASALRDAGFTLAGGGVAQHSRSGGSGPGGDDPDGRGRSERRTVRGEAIAAAAVQRTSHRVAAGGIDLYA